MRQVMSSYGLQARSVTVGHQFTLPSQSRSILVRPGSWNKELVWRSGGSLWKKLVHFFYHVVLGQVVLNPAAAMNTQAVRGACVVLTRGLWVHASIGSWVRGGSILRYVFFWNLHTDFCSGFASLHSEFLFFSRQGFSV